MKTIDNSGRGNCMYYAYAISLMYYLRKQSQGIRDEVFTKLQTSEENKTQLCTLLVATKDTISPFTLRETQMIERILGPDCRALAGDHTQTEFLADPPGSSTVTAAAYGIACALNNSLIPEYAGLIELPDTRSINGKPSAAESFTKADIFNVSGMNAAIESFSKENASDVVKSFIDRQGLSAADPQNKLTKEQIMDEIIREKTIAFLQNKDHAQLNQYINHLKQDFIWGTEETLLSLHRAVTGEKKNSASQWVTDTPISIMILADGNVEPWQQPEACDIVLNNKGNNHWVSSIPSNFLVSDTHLDALCQFNCLLKKIIHRYYDLSPQSEYGTIRFISMLWKKLTQLDQLIQRYSHTGMNNFIKDFTKAMSTAAPGTRFLDCKYVSENICNVLNASWHMVKLALARLISIVCPDMLKHLQANVPVEYGVKDDIKKAQALFGYFKPKHTINNQHAPAYVGTDSHPAHY